MNKISPTYVHTVINLNESSTFCVLYSLKLPFSLFATQDASILKNWSGSINVYIHVGGRLTHPAEKLQVLVTQGESLCYAS